MNHQGKWLACGVVCAAIASGFVACGRIDASDAFTALQIKQVQVLSGGDCSIPGTPTTLFRDHGVLDLDLPDGSTPPYYLPVLVANNMDSAGGSKASEMNNMTLSHFTVELSAPGVTWSDSCPATFDTQTITDVIPPGGSVGAGFNIITAAHSQCLQPQVPASHLSVKATIKAKGRHGGTGIESAPFIYTVDVCAGCLQRAYTDPALAPYQYPADVPMCSTFAGSSNPYSGDPCLSPGQDTTIFCCGINQTVGGKSQRVPRCPGIFPAAPTATATSTATDTSTSTTTTTTTATP